ncbi:MAG TPA: hypothetical protein VN253_29715 [Kofleriaceae bacterium]|nr:hypothetical protein [Kofleriaceae bacterium]
MRRLFLALAVVGSLMSVSRTTSADYYVEYYRDNLFLGLAYHRMGCLSDWYTIQSNQDYDGFTNSRYCYQGATSDYVPNASWYDYEYLSSSLSTARSRLDSCGAKANAKYGTPNYAASSNTCSYNILTNCNSDCWIYYFSTCNGYSVGIESPCFGYSYP